MIKKLWYIHTMEYYSAIKRNAFDSVLMRWMNLEPITQSELSQKKKDKYSILIYIYIYIYTYIYIYIYIHTYIYIYIYIWNLERWY